MDKTLSKKEKVTEKPTLVMSRIQISNTFCSYCWRVVKPFIAVLVTTVVQVLEVVQVVVG